MRTIILFMTLAFSMFCSAAAGPEIAQALNARYNNIVQECNGASAVFCSGVLLHGHPLPRTGFFWEHDDHSKTLDSEDFTYIRQDISTRALDAPFGGVFDDLATAQAQDKPLDILCIYPFALETQVTWADNGCRAPAISISDDKSSCASLGVTDAAGWLAYFQQQGNPPLPEQQCSFSAVLTSQFSASLEAHELMGTPWAVRSNQLMVKNWNDDQPGRLPVQAMYYTASDPQNLLSAQGDQQRYFEMTGHWLPLLKLDLSASDRNIFSYNRQDQIDAGFDVARHLNDRYADTATACDDGRAAYYCNGVLIRGAVATNEYHAWDPSPGSITRDGVSFSYLRADVGQTLVLGDAGFIFKQLDLATTYPIAVRCSYPFDASTGLFTDACLDAKECLNEGVTTVSKYVAFIAGPPPRKSCAFSPSQAQFQLSIDARAAHRSGLRRSFNEVMLAAWSPGIPKQLPLEALFYRTDWPGPEPLMNAQFIQHDYYEQTTSLLPIVRFNPDAVDGHLFAYVPGDQNPSEVEK